MISASPAAVETKRIYAALAKATTVLMQGRVAAGYWTGELSSSALSTATAIIALTLSSRERAQQGSRHAPAAASQHKDFSKQISIGLAWLGRHANADGGWGDTTQSLSNISTTALCWAAFGVVPGADAQYREIVNHAEEWLGVREDPGGRNTPQEPLITAIIARYGRDRTFSVPILTACALAGRFGAGREVWKSILPLPFELAAFPRQWFAALRLPVVSYALPALIAIGQARHAHLPSRNPLARLARNMARERTLKILTQIQPSSGGFLEATPLTSFVVMSLAGSGKAHHPVTEKGIEFLLKAQRPDGSWAIDSNLATWLTTLSINSISNSDLEIFFSQSAMTGQSTDSWRCKICMWILDQQYSRKHAYTQAAPGGWAWTNLPGGVPDSDDTAGAVLALAKLQRVLPLPDRMPNEAIRQAAMQGIRWLLDLQNRDGGIPTFCRGWGTLPFDRSSPDITAHTMRCWLAWLDELPDHERRGIAKGIERAVEFLACTQRPDGAWAPLWFGNQFAPGDLNLTYGTARVTTALLDFLVREPTNHKATLLFQKGIAWLVRAQNSNGGWGGAEGITSSIEETALAVEALAATDVSTISEYREALNRGITWLLDKVESGGWIQPSPIGFYFASLWYYEKLYPQIFTVAALARVCHTQAMQNAGPKEVPRSKQQPSS